MSAAREVPHLRENLMNNIPIIAIVLVGLFTKRVPALGAKIVIVFHVLAYGALKFLFDDVVTLHFLHLYAILFAIEVGIMLLCGRLAPRPTPWTFKPNQKVDLTPWRFTTPVCITLLLMVVAVYLLFSPIGLADGELGVLYWGLNLVIAMGIGAAWVRAVRNASNMDERARAR